MKRYTHFIDGEFTPEAAGEIDSIDPATGEIWSRISRGDAEDADRAVRAADRTFRKGEWADASAGDRADILDHLADHLAAHWEKLVGPKSGTMASVSRKCGGSFPIYTLGSGISPGKRASCVSNGRTTEFPALKARRTSSPTAWSLRSLPGTLP